jgi:hypothetical protein
MRIARTSDEPVTVGHDDVLGAGEFISPERIGRRRANQAEAGAGPVEMVIEPDRLAAAVRAEQTAVDEDVVAGQNRVRDGGDREVVVVSGRSTGRAGSNKAPEHRERTRHRNDA